MREGRGPFRSWKPAAPTRAPRPYGSFLNVYGPCCLQDVDHLHDGIGGAVRMNDHTYIVETGGKRKSSSGGPIGLPKRIDAFKHWQSPP
jgi:hypothetical protein